jgi:hypothetical protein
MLKVQPRLRKPAAIRRTKSTTARAVRSLAPATPGTEIVIGVLVGWDNGGPLVDFEGNGRGPLRARVMGSPNQPRPGSPAQQEVVLMVDRKSRRQPVLLGLLSPLGTDGAGTTDLEARVDGRRVELDGRDEVVLRCGEASITLRRNGRILIRGVQVETRASGLNRIKGGSVAIN